MSYSEDQLRVVVDTIPALAWSARPDGFVEFFNQRWVDYTGVSAAEARDWGWTVAIHPDDLKRLLDYWRSTLGSGEPGEIEGRLRRSDGVYRWFLFRATPSFDGEGKLVKWFGTNTDIEDRKRTEDALRASEESFRLIVNSIPGFVSTLTPAGEIEFVNQQVLDYFGRTLDELRDWATSDAVYVDDLPDVIATWRASIETGQPSEIELRLRRADGAYRWFLLRRLPHRDADGHILRWYTMHADIDDWKRADDRLRAAMAERARLSTVREEIAMALAGKDTLRGILHKCADTLVRHLDAAFARIWTLQNGCGELELQASAGMYTRLDGRFSRIPVGDIKIGLIAQERKAHLTNDVQNDARISDHNWARVEQIRSFAGYPLIVEDRVVGVIGMFSRQTVTQSILEVLASIAGGIAQGIERKRTEDALRASEENLRLTLDSIDGLVTAFSPSGELEFANRRFLEYTGNTLEQLKTNRGIIHPDDRERVLGQCAHSLRTGEPLYAEARVRRHDGVFRWFFTTALPLTDKNNHVIRWHSLITDIDDRKQAEEKVRRSEADLLEAQRLTHTGSWKHDVASGKVIVSPEIHRMFGSSPDHDTSDPELWFSRIHPEDRKHTQDLFERSEIEKTNYEADYRIVLPDGTIRYQHSLGHPILNESGELVEFVGTAMDVTEEVLSRARLETAFAEIKLLKDQLYRENLALRDEVDRTSMFEEIVGKSPALQAVLSRVAQVAPTDSTVLITGETGTGKELIARALHKQSPRAQRAFVSVNCAALAPSLISSELFGHERGAFTGAVQRRLGRFELANGGTIFLDEVGELPADAQVALLRVLQEREFERVGGKESIRVDVRVIAATNRNLEAATANKAFRSDLFYRLNVFPIEVPPLRERKDDVLILLEYFVDRYARKAGKKFKNIDKRTLELFRSYEWPGNIRELQNVVERSVIVSQGELFRVDEAWLTTGASRTPVPKPAPQGMESDSNRERLIIESALAESRGRVYGPHGAAAKLRVPPSTLDSKIKKLKIRKSHFKFGEA